MSKDLMIIGAGTGFARATARQFGQAGWSVHLVARSAAGLARLAASLAEESIDVHTHVGDVTRHVELSALVAAVDDETALDACIFQPRGDEAVVDVLDVSVANVRPHLEMLVLGAVAVGSVLAPRMIERRSGSLVFVGGGSARTPLRFFGNLGMAMSGLRNYALTLGGAVAESNVHSAFYTAAGVIGCEGNVGTDELDPRQLADRMYTLIRDRDAREVLMTPGGEVVPRGAK